MNRSVPQQISYDRVNKGVDIREPSTANFLIDSTDRPGYNAESIYPVPFVPGTPLVTSSADFTITKPGNSLFNGFFTRFAMTELTLTWNVPNISALAGNSSTQVVYVPLVGQPGVVYTITIPDGFYTVEEAITALIAQMNLVINPVVPFTVLAPTPGQAPVLPGTQYNYNAIITGPGADFFSFFRATPVPVAVNAPGNPAVPGNSLQVGTAPEPYVPNLAQALGLLTLNSRPADADVTFYWNYIANPLVLSTTYLDFVSPTIAQNQSVKDGSSSKLDGDIIYRWNFAEELPTGYDGLGFPLLQGYRPFRIRRYIAFPKHFRWDPLIPLGQCRFLIYNDQAVLQQYKKGLERLEFQMLFLVSEV